jgi:hypothetical protein
VVLTAGSTLGVGRLIEHDQTDRTQWMVPAAAVPERLLIETDGVHTPMRGSVGTAYHAAKVGRVGARGPALREDPETGRVTLVLGPSTFCVGLEHAHDFFPRLTREAWRAGFTRGVRQIVFLGDGARWIWQQVRTQCSSPGVEVIEIVDFFHASEHLGEVATAVFGKGTLLARSWWAEQRHALLHQGPAPVLAALAVLAARPDLDAEARTVLRRNREEYFTDNVARMDYPAFLARHLPVGSGAVESACKQLISQRAKGAGMRWTAPGAHYIANLRALYHSAAARWDTFWATQPLTRLRLLPSETAVPAPRAVPDLPPAAPTTSALPATDLPAPALPDASTAPPPAAAATQRIATTGKPWAKGPGYWRRIAASHARSA